MMSKFEKAAQENANYFGKPYVVFLGSDLKPRVERYDATCSCHNEPSANIFYPHRSDDSAIKLLGEIP